MAIMIFLTKTLQSGTSEIELDDVIANLRSIQDYGSRESILQSMTLLEEKMKPVGGWVVFEAVGVRGRGNKQTYRLTWPEGHPLNV